MEKNIEIAKWTYLINALLIELLTSFFNSSQPKMIFQSIFPLLKSGNSNLIESIFCLIGGPIFIREYAHICQNIINS